MTKVLKFIKKEFLLVIAILGAVITAFFVPIDKNYLNYIDKRTLISLFVFMAVIAAFKDIMVFRYAASIFLKKFNSTRKLVFALVFITFIFSMFIANDMALLTFLPFTLMIFRNYKNTKLCIFTIVMQNIAANLGGLLTPFGNPQNLFLYSYYSIPTLEFFKIMSVPFLISIVLIVASCFIIKNKPINTEIASYPVPDKKKLAVFTIMFLVAILMVLRVISFYYSALAIIVALIFTDFKAFKGVDYSLLFTFFAFFIFSGNLSRIPAVSDLITYLINQNVLLYATISCQFISNVPTAILFSYLTPYELYPKLLLAVNIGGLGTLIASLASLISFKAFAKEYPGEGLRYLKMFSLINFSFLIIILIITTLIIF